MLEAARGHPQEALFVLALATGMRRGELMALKGQDIDFAIGTIHIQRTLSRIPDKLAAKKGKGYEQVEPKTRKSRRSIVIAPFALHALKRHRLHQLEVKRKAGPAWQDHDYVFCTSVGTHLNPTNDILDPFKELLSVCGAEERARHRPSEEDRVAGSQQVNRIQKVLETANSKLTSVVSDILGKSGQAMLEALVEGQSDPEALAELARGSLRGKLPALREALEGQVQAHQRALLYQLLAHIEFLEHSVASLAAEVEQRLAPYQEAIGRLMQIPGVQRLTAISILAEIGPDMSRFPSVKHLASWAGVAPGNNQSGGKRLSAPGPKGNRWLRAALAEAVWVISHTKENYLSAQYHRLARRIGKKKAVVAVSHSLLGIIYHVLREQTDYHDLGRTISSTWTKSACAPKRYVG